MNLDTILSNLLGLVLSIPGAVFAFSLRGYGQAFVSDKLGDPTPRNNGKLTLNPLAHIDILGFIFILLFRFGWGKPVPMNSKFYKNYKKDSFLVAISGPLFLIAGGITLALFYGVFPNVYLVFQNEFIEIFANVFYYASWICLSLAFFYLLPIPGLDGYKAMLVYTPYKWNEFFYKLEKYSLFIFIGVILIGEYIPGINLFFSIPGYILNFLTKYSTILWGFIF